MKNSSTASDSTNKTETAILPTTKSKLATLKDESNKKNKENMSGGAMSKVKVCLPACLPAAHLLAGTFEKKLSRCKAEHKATSIQP